MRYGDEETGAVLVLSDLLVPDYVYRQILQLFLLISIQYSNGLLVLRKNVKVNYTRKINHFALFFIPIYLGQGYLHEDSLPLLILGAALAIFKFVFYTKSVRDRVPLIRTMFRSFDRPEDRPHTLLWLTTQTAVGYVVIITMGMMLVQHDLRHLILIPIFIYGIGDGLAEPVGVRFGKHKYGVRALFSSRTYYRSLEGSACVWVTGLLVVLAHQAYFTAGQLGWALAIVPLAMTAAEAVSPHTWDSPLMLLAGYASLLGIMVL